MKKQIFSIGSAAILLMAGIAMTGCNKNEPKEPAKVQTYHVRIQAGKGDANRQNGPRRVLSLDGTTLNATWAIGEQVTVRNLTKEADLTGSLTAESDGVQTVISGDLTGTINAGDELKLKFLSPDYTTQEGTLEYIESHCDYAVATIHVESVTYGSITFEENIADFENQQAIVKFTLKDGDDPIAATELVVEVEGASYTITPASATSELFVALPGFSDQTITLTATVGSDTYTYTSSGNKTLEDSKYYAITVGMSKKVLGFSIDPTHQIEFAHGNLQYNDTAVSTPKWRIAEHQYDYVGDANTSLTFGSHEVGNVYVNGVKCNNEKVENNALRINDEGWIDLLSWSCQDNTDPLSMSMDRQDFIRGGFKDWGENEIYDPAKKIIYPANTWRTLSISEWQYIFCHRPNYDELFSLASIDGLTYGNVKGFILLPDNFVMPAGIDFVPAKNIFEHTNGTNSFTYANNPDYNYDNYPDYHEQLEDPANESDPDFMYNKNHYTLAQWELLEEAGAVFLPAAGRRDRYPAYNMDFVIYTSIQANYWSSTFEPENGTKTEPYYIGANPDNDINTVIADKTMAPYFGMSVRLVRDLQ